MTSVLQALVIAVQAAFVALALFTLTDWVRHRDRQRLWLVVALVSLSALVVLTPAAALVGLPVQLVTDLALVLFVLSGYALLMFRTSLIPLGRRLAAAITVWTVMAAARRLPSGMSEFRNISSAYPESTNRTRARSVTSCTGRPTSAAAGVSTTRADRDTRATTSHSRWRSRWRTQSVSVNRASATKAAWTAMTRACRTEVIRRSLLHRRHFNDIRGSPLGRRARTAAIDR